jgi:hypothetical protein
MSTGQAVVITWTASITLCSAAMPMVFLLRLLQFDYVNDNVKRPIDRHFMIITAEQCGEQIAVNPPFKSPANRDNMIVEHFAAGSKL